MLRVGIAGLGTVGAGVYKIIEENAELLFARSGKKIVVTAVSAKTKAKDRGINIKNITWYDNPEHIATDPNIDVVCELIGGAEGAALEVCTKALKSKKHVVTANKALISRHGVKLAELAEKNGVSLVFEASVAGGIPVIKVIKEGLAGNKLSSIAGILNGTCNYILTSMAKEKKDFAVALAEAQKLGYAEADPSFDVDGVDAAHKLSILAALAIGTAPALESIFIEGISDITLSDIEFAEELGFKIKLLGIMRSHDKEIELRVHPCLLPKDSVISKVDGVINAVTIEGDNVGKIFIEGAGAGRGPTASAVVADIVDIARGNNVFSLNTHVTNLKKVKYSKISEHSGSYYLRLTVFDKPGVVADVTDVLRKKNISIETLLQKANKSNGTAEIIIITHETSEEAMAKALQAISKLEHNSQKPHLIRIESI